VKSGNIAAIGYDLYLDLLQRTVADLKAKTDTGEESTSLTSLDPEINLQISAYIPAVYIPDISQRYITYRRIAALVSSPPELFEDLRDELQDRYGAIPEETVNLLQIVAVKKELARLRIHKLEKGRNTLVFHFSDDTPVSPEMLMAYLRHHTSKRKGIAPRITPEGRLIINGEMASTAETFETISRAINNLDKLTHADN